MKRLITKNHKPTEHTSPQYNIQRKEIDDHPFSKLGFLSYIVVKRGWFRNQ